MRLIDADELLEKIVWLPSVNGIPATVNHNRPLIDIAQACDAIKEQPTINEWIPCSDRLPTEEECLDLGSNLFEVTMIVRNKFRITDYCLIHTDYKTWHTKDDTEVVAWRYKVKPFMT